MYLKVWFACSRETLGLWILRDRKNFTPSVKCDSALYRTCLAFKSIKIYLFVSNRQHYLHHKKTHVHTYKFRNEITLQDIEAAIYLFVNFSKASNYCICNLCGTWYFSVLHYKRWTITVFCLVFFWGNQRHQKIWIMVYNGIFKGLQCQNYFLFFSVGMVYSNMKIPLLYSSF